MRKIKIAVLGWGSLVWCPKSLKIKDKNWKKDGPKLPIEFARISRDKRLTLVIYDEYLDQKEDWVKTLWNILDVSSIEEAIKNLGEREGTTCKNIGFIYKKASHLKEEMKDMRRYCEKISLNKIKEVGISECDYYYNYKKLNAEGKARYEERKTKYVNSIIKSIEKWMSDKSLDGVVWTELEPKFKYDDKSLNSDTILKYIECLKCVDKDKWERAKEYIFLTPKQIKTKLRQVLEKRLE